jgi:putative (di)nucleoside polyphosphate hydrolase
MVNINKKYRKNVAAIVLAPSYPLKCEFFLASRIDLKNIWQFPQGGIEEHETPKEALYRELKEEIGTDDIEIIAEYPEWISYDFPERAKRKMLPYDGQTQKYFLVKLNSIDKIDIKTKEPEFDKYIFLEKDALYCKIAKFKKDIYKTVIGYFKQEGYL